MDTVERIFELVDISIHAPREGSDHVATNIAFLLEIFQSTLPVRGATAEQFIRQCAKHNISIHAPREGSDSKTVQTVHIQFSTSAQLCARVWEIFRSPGRYVRCRRMARHEKQCEPAGQVVSASRSHAGALRGSAALRADTSAWRRSARSCSHSACQGSRTADCPSPGP